MSDGEKDLTFTIMGVTITLISDECYFGRNTVAQVGEDQFQYMGDEYPSFETALAAWQEINNRDLSDDEMHNVLIENGFIKVLGEKNASQEISQEDGYQEITEEDILEEIPCQEDAKVPKEAN